MDAPQFRTPPYCPGGEFMYLVLTTSTGEAMTVVHRPAPKADTKWQGRLSVGQRSGVGAGGGYRSATENLGSNIWVFPDVPVRGVDFSRVSLIRS